MPDFIHLWTPLPRSEWNEETARHLAARLGFSIHPARVAEVTKNGPDGTLKHLLGEVKLMPRPEMLEEGNTSMAPFMGPASLDDAERGRQRQAVQRQQRIAHQDYAHAWYDFTRQPAHSAQEKLVQLFQNIWVVAFAKVRDTSALFDYQQRIRRCLGGTYPEMCQQLALDPAMMRYLDLNRNSKEAPNENFARELFELFCLGEGHYTEKDVKEAARALTGYTLDKGHVRFRPQRHDASNKTIFGVTGRHDLPKLIDLVFQQPAAARFLPQELARSYLIDGGLSAELIQPLADDWKASGFSIPHLLARFFQSRIFYDPAYRGNMIKTPVHYYIGLLQDLDLDVFPSPRRAGNLVRLMGQAFFNPPNVRGWVGGRQWINTATLAARRQMAQGLLEPIDTGRLNADEKRAWERATAARKDRFTVPAERLQQLAKLEPDELAKQLAKRLHIQPETGQLEELFSRLREGRNHAEWMRICLFATLTAPAYHLC